METLNEIAPVTGKLVAHAKTTVEKSADLQESTKARVQDTIRSANRVIANAHTTTAKTIKNAAMSADEHVRENPWIALGVISAVAATVGYFARLLSARRSRRWMQR